MEIYTFLWGMSNVDYRNVDEEEEVGKQCARRPPDGWPSRTLHFPRPPCIPPRGNSRPPASQG